MSKDNEVLKFVIRYKVAHQGNSPSYEEISEACGVKSRSHVAKILDKLQESGALEHNGVKNISIPNSKWIQEA